jgi:hypothetical protein
MAAATTAGLQRADTDSPAPAACAIAAAAAAAVCGGGAGAGFRGLLAPRYRRVMLLATALPALQQMSGINTVILYGSKVFSSAGVRSPIASNLIMGGVNLAATGGAAALMDRAGRKRLLTWSFVGMAACLAAMASFLLLPSESRGCLAGFRALRVRATRAHSAAAVISPLLSLHTGPCPRAAPHRLAAPATFACVLAYIVAFALGCGPCPWVYLPEIFPEEIKGPAQSVGTAVSWLGNLAVGLSFPPMLRALGLGGSYAVYAALCAAAAAVCRQHMVETARRPLAEVHAELAGQLDGS